MGNAIKSLAARMPSAHLFLSIFSAVALAMSGCESSDDSSSSTYWKTEEKKPAKTSSTSSSNSTTSSTSSSHVSGDSATKSATATADGEIGALDDIPFSSLHWSFGGVNGSKAKKTTASIGHLRATDKNMSYRWTGPTLSSWGLSNGDAGALACFFVMRSDGRWVGGKFDWISTSRTSRSFTNIRSGYNGWSLSGVPNPCPCAFVIVSGDCKKRTNVIAGTWSR